jgi:shikimate dehydrogenase
VAASLDEPVIINTTPLGLSGANAAASPWPDDAPFPRGAFVYDLVYNPRRTQLMEQAGAAGIRAANGLGMLVRQAAEAFEIMTAHRPDPEVMRQVIEE